MVNPCTDFEVLKLNNLVDWKSNVGDKIFSELEWMNHIAEVCKGFENY